MNDLSATSRRHRILILVVVLLGMPTTRAAADPLFTVTDLGPGGAVGINASGQVLIENGRSASIVDTAGPNAPAVTSLPGDGQDHPDISAVAINARGQVIVQSEVGPQILSTGGGGPGTWNALGISGAANAINDLGQIAGSTGINVPQAYLYDGTISQLGTLGGASSSAYGINNDGQVVGSAETTSGALHAFVWSSGKMTDLGTLGGPNSSALAINSSGQIVGLSYTANGDERAFLYTNQTMKDLGTLPGDQSSLASRINAMGEIIGMSFTYPNTPHYFLYRNGVMQDINSLLSAGTGWTISNITGLNDLGQIVGQGYDSVDGSEHAILLTPEVPEPSSIALPIILAGAAAAPGLTAAYEQLLRDIRDRFFGDRYKIEATPMPAIFDRLLILGLDGATWTVLDPMRRRGLMPNLDALLARSAHGTLRSIVPPVTTAAWTTVMTGCGPARHGLFDHRYYDTNAGQMKVNHSGRVRVPTFWHILSQAGRSVVSLNVPATYPPLNVRGVVVSGMDAPHLEAALSGAPEFARRLRAEVPGYTLRYFWKRAPLSLDELAENARLTAESFRGRAEGGLLADKVVPDWAALMVQFQNLDPFQHRAWRYLNVDETGINNAPWNAAAGSVLRGLDDAIGLLIELADQRNAAILVVSDHGFGPCQGRIHVNRILVEAGVARLPGLSGRLGRRARQAVDRFRLWGAKRDDPGARASSFDLSVVAQFPFDWKRTLAFAPHQDTAAMVYLNSASRTAGAPIQTLRQLDDARAAASDALSRARHPETGKALFPKIVATAEAYGIDPAREGYPDLIALPDDPYWVRTKLAPGTAWVEADPNLPGTHRPEGIVALAGTGIAPGRMLTADLPDVAPTVLKLLGVPIPPHMEGKPLACLGPVPVAAPRQDPGTVAVAGPHPPQFEYTPEEQAIIEQRLADLGYLE